MNNHMNSRIKTPNGFAAITGGVRQTPVLGTAQLLDGYSHFPWLRAVADKIGQGTGNLDWQLFFGDQEVEENPLITLLDNPNPNMDGNSFFKLAGKHMTLCNEVFWMIERNAIGMPVELWPLSPAWILDTPKPGEGDLGTYEVQMGRWRTRFAANDIIYIRDMDPANPYGRSSSAAKALGDEIEADEFAAKYVKSFFINGARPDLLIYSDDPENPIGENDAQRLESKWNAKLQGIRNKFKSFFLTGKVGIKELQASIKDMDLTEQRKYWRDMIIQVYGLPPEALGIVENSNRATIAAAEFFLTKHVIVPIADTLTSGMQTHLVPQFDERLILGYVSPVQEDREHKTSVYKDHPWAFKADEIRKVAGDEPLDNNEGQVYASAFNQVFTDTPGGGGTLPAEPKSLLEQLRKELGNGGLLKLLDQTPEALSYNKAIDLTDIDEIVGVLGPEEFAPGVAQSNSATVEAFGQTVIDQVETGVSFNLSAPRVTEFLRDQSSTRIVGLINPTTRDTLRKALAEGIGEGEGAAQLAGRIRGVFDQARGSRAFKIARTESVRASNFGSLSAMKQVRIPQKQWLTVGDSNVRDTHSELNGKIVETNNSFQSSAGFAQYPGDFGIAAEDIECRCNILAVIGEASMRNTDTKTFERQRQPFERLIESAYIKGFDEQEILVLNALENI